MIAGNAGTRTDRSRGPARTARKLVTLGDSFLQKLRATSVQSLLAGPRRLRFHSSFHAVNGS